ncbi:TIGR01459 family HAD-type hydrolase [Pseudaquidulcibacter saccharophilus]|uniref:TIGR01459 family HAD-type hydrolase n=1 Tax=Pseudaquidulcibacter saccharophilus TaxID=2831900 RepID=UPI001EFF1C8D|nr:TIGR01459 family HAD-type hydrolase [Pseudaquidulcibacter saccharophilus]
MKTTIIQKFSEISSNYDVLLCDVWGVIHNGREGFGPALDALRAAKAKGLTIVLISNSPRPCEQIGPQMASIGIENDFYDAIVTSGDAILDAMEKRGSKAYPILTGKDNSLIEKMNASLVDNPKDADFIICTGPRNDLVETAEDYRKELEMLADVGLPFFCANPDRVVQFGGRLITCAGALADIYEELGGEVIMAGKPNPPIYELAFDKIRQIRGDFYPSRVLCIGDGIQTDVEGAFHQKLDCLFITGGIHMAELSGPNGLDEERTAAFLSSRGLHAKYAMVDLI